MMSTSFMPLTSDGTKTPPAFGESVLCRGVKTGWSG